MVYFFREIYLYLIVYYAGLKIMEVAHDNATSVKKYITEHRTVIVFNTIKYVHVQYGSGRGENSVATEWSTRN